MIERLAKTIAHTKNGGECHVVDWHVEARDNPLIARALKEANAPLSRPCGSRVGRFEAREHGLAAGFAVPFSGRQGERGSLSLGGDRIEIPPAAAGFLALAASFAAEQAMSLTDMDEVRAPLTPRERDCLLWTAEGKTEWETACILCITPATVASHLAAARRKLDASNKPHLVAKAFRAGLIR